MRDATILSADGKREPVTATWIRSIDPFRLIPLPTQTYLHVDDQACPEPALSKAEGPSRGGTPRLLQWADQGLVDPILIRRGKGGVV